MWRECGELPWQLQIQEKGGFSLHIVSRWPLHSEAKGCSPKAIPYLPVLLRSKILAILGPPREWMVD